MEKADFKTGDIVWRHYHRPISSGSVPWHVNDVTEFGVVFGHGLDHSSHQHTIPHEVIESGVPYVYEKMPEEDASYWRGIYTNADHSF